MAAPPVDDPLRRLSDIIGAMCVRALTVIALISSSCASKQPSVRYNGRVIAEFPASRVMSYDGEPDAPCGHVEVGTVDVSCPGGCTFDEASAAAEARVAQAGVNVIAKVRVTTTGNGRVVGLHGVAVEVFGCVMHSHEPWLPTKE